MAYVHATREREVSLEIYQGATFTLKLRWLDEDDNPVDLTGASAEMHIREDFDSDTTLYEASSDTGEITFDPSQGRVILTIPAADTADFDWGHGVYDMLVTHAGGTPVNPIVRGGVGVKPAVTRS